MFKQFVGVIGCSAALIAGGAVAQTKEFKLGVIFDSTGPFADAGSYAGHLGAKYAIDIFKIGRAHV